MTHDQFMLVQLKANLTLHEGKRLFPYLDTVGKLAIGVGRNLDDVGISEDEISLLLENDIRRAMKDCILNLPFFIELDPVRKAVLVELAFNMGIGNATRGLLSFKNTLRAVSEGRYGDAADGMLKSKWARQVKGARAGRLAGMMRTGEWPELPT